jgi:hypothetical protein
MSALPSLRTFPGLLCVGCTLLAIAGPSVGQNAAKTTGWDTAPPRKAAPGDDELQRLRIDRYNAALEEFQARRQEFPAGRFETDLQLHAGDRLWKSALALSVTPAERVVIHQHAVDFAKSLEEGLQVKLKEQEEKKVDPLAYKVTTRDCAQARGWRLNAEERLLEEKQKMQKPKGP